MNKEWTVEDVKSYYGEWFANDIEVQDAMDEVKRRYVRVYGREWNSTFGFSDKMRLMRRYLKDQFGIETIFTIGYRRAKV
jgi:hypothetical protein